MAIPMRPLSCAEARDEAARRIFEPLETHVETDPAQAHAFGQQKALGVELDVALEAIEDGGVKRLVGPYALTARDRRLGGRCHSQPLGSGSHRAGINTRSR